MEILIGGVIMVAAQICKRWITPKYGATGVHVFIAVLAVVVSGLQFWSAHDPHVLDLLGKAALLLTATVGTYHVLFEKIGQALAPMGASNY